jgi:hypothetical protein
MIFTNNKIKIISIFKMGKFINPFDEREILKCSDLVMKMWWWCQTVDAFNFDSMADFHRLFDDLLIRIATDDFNHWNSFTHNCRDNFILFCVPSLQPISRFYRERSAISCQKYSVFERSNFEIILWKVFNSRNIGVEDSMNSADSNLDNSWNLAEEVEWQQEDDSFIRLVKFHGTQIAHELVIWWIIQ